MMRQGTVGGGYQRDSLCRSESPVTQAVHSLFPPRGVFFVFSDPFGSFARSCDMQHLGLVK